MYNPQLRILFSIRWEKELLHA